MSIIKLNNSNVDGNADIWEGELTDLPFTRDFLDADVQWGANSRSELKHSRYKQERKEFKDEYSDVVSNWLNSVKKNNNILDIISDLLDREENRKHFYKLYPIEGVPTTIKEYLHKNCDVLYRVIRDQPGFNMNKHFDNRAVLGNMFFNLVDNDKISTQFFRTFNDGSIRELNVDTYHYYNAPTYSGGGIFFLNSYNTFHTIEHTSDKNRYVLNIVVYFKDLTW